MALLSDLKKYFTALTKNGRLGRSYIIFGSGEKLPLARALANFLENKKWEEPNGILIDNLVIEASDFSGIRHILAQKPLKSPRRMVIINDAQYLSANDQNALLKIVEEPPASALIILLVPDSGAILPTLASRCEKIYFSAAQDSVKIDATAAQLAKEFLSAPAKRRSDIIKEVIDVENGRDLLDNFIKALLFEFKKDPIKNYGVLKELIKRWSLIKQFNVNKRLQLEAALL